MKHEKTKTTDIMKRILSTLAVLAVSSVSLFAQMTMKQVTELYNNGATALGNGDKTAAVEAFKEALKAADAVGEEGMEIATKCREYIPQISLSAAKDLVKTGDYDNALNALAEVSKTATEFGAEDVVSEIATLLPQVKMSKAGALLNAKDYAGAAEAYKAVLEAEPENGVAALRLGMALNGAGDAEGAVAAFETAAANGQESVAKKQLGNIFLRQAQAALKSGKYADCAAAVEKSVTYVENPQAYYLAGSAMTKAGKKADSIKYYEKYLELSPKAANAGMVAYTIGATYQQLGNKAKAKEYYLKASTDPKIGADAKKLAASL